MQSADRFELDFARRLREELNAAEIRLPRAQEVRRASRSLPVYGMMPSLAVALVATLAISFLAIAFTGSANPTVWVKPAVWMRSLGISQPTASPSPSAEPEERESPRPSPEHEPTPASGSNEPDAGAGQEPPEARTDDGGRLAASPSESRHEPDD